jgi:serine/threonine protein kinase
MAVLSRDVDELDGAPVWSCAQGDELPGGYLAWERLGVGLRCETWLVWSVPLWCPAVLKLPRPHQVEHPRAARSLAREVAALGGDPHPALPRLYRDGTAADIPHIVMEHIDGPALDEELASSGALSEPEVALLGAQLLTGLLALHRNNIAHVDLTPANIILRDMRPVLIDFGAARRIGTPQPAGRLNGTPGYAAPELETGEPISAGMDLYGLGAILHEASTGRPTFDPTYPAPERPPPQALGHTPLAELVLALLRPDPAKRPYSHEALTTFAATVPEDLRPWPSWADPLAPSAGL